jgi:CBS domain containing-hemolysin-like protein
VGAGPMSDWVPGLVWLVVLLGFNAFFVGAEFAVIAARRSQIEPLADAGGRAARTTLWAMEHATLMLAASQLGITICSLLILNVSEPAIHHLLEYPLALTPLSAPAIGVVAFVISLVLVTFLHVVLGEMVPKNLSFSVPERASLVLAPPLVLFGRIFKPVIVALNWSATAVVRLFGVQPRDEATSTYTLDEVANIVELSTREGVLRDTTGTLSNAFDFTASKVQDVALPLTTILTLPVTATPADIQQAVEEVGFSRYILTDGSQPVGYLHLKDVLDLNTPESFGRPVPAKRIRSIDSVPCTSDLEEALALMRRHGSHLARAVDPQGETVGVVFLEDMLEVLVGQVQDSTQ